MRRYRMVPSVIQLTVALVPSSCNSPWCFLHLHSLSDLWHLPWYEKDWSHIKLPCQYHRSVHWPRRSMSAIIWWSICQRCLQPWGCREQSSASEGIPDPTRRDGTAMYSSNEAMKEQQMQFVPSAVCRIQGASVHSLEHSRCSNMPSQWRACRPTRSLPEILNSTENLSNYTCVDQS